MSDKNDVIYIELDRPRQLRYGHSALKKLSALTGKSMDQFEVEEIDLEQIETYIYCGLLTDARENNETLRLEDMEELLDQAPSFAHIVQKMQEAFAASFAGVENLEGNEQISAPKPNRQQRRAAKSGAGKKA